MPDVCNSHKLNKLVPDVHESRTMKKMGFCCVQIMDQDIIKMRHIIDSKKNTIVFTFTLALSLHTHNMCM